MSKHIAKHLASLEEFEVESVDTVGELETPVEPEVVDDEPVLEVAVTDTTGEVEEVAVTNDGDQVEIVEDVTEMDGEYQPALDAEEDVVDQSLNELGLVEQEIIDNGNDIDTAVEATIALEQYAAILYKCRRDGISQETAKFLKIGVDLAERSLGSKVAFGIEDYAYTPRSSVMVASVSYEDFKEKLGNAKKYITELWQKFLTLVERQSKELASGLLMVRKKFRSIDENIAAYGIKQEEIQVPSKLVDRFAVDGKVTVKNLEEYASILDGLVQFQVKLLPAIKKEIVDKMREPIVGNPNDLTYALDALGQVMDRTDLGRHIPTELKNDPTLGNLRVILGEGSYDGSATFVVDDDLKSTAEVDDLVFDDAQNKTSVLRAVRKAIASLDELTGIHDKVDELKAAVNTLKEEATKLGDKQEGEDNDVMKIVKSIVSVGQNQTMSVFTNMRQTARAYNTFAAVLGLYVAKKAEK